jgi:hypothetical protein
VGDPIDDPCWFKEDRMMKKDCLRRGVCGVREWPHGATTPWSSSNEPSKSRAGRNSFSLKSLDETVSGLIIWSRREEAKRDFVITGHPCIVVDLHPRESVEFATSTDQSLHANTPMSIPFGELLGLWQEHGRL